jgi:DMSO/TMAO reductase YedYZ molybdopterin-dependent catalytic subunit
LQLTRLFSPGLLLYLSKDTGVARFVTMTRMDRELRKVGTRLKVQGFFGRLPCEPRDLTDRITPAEKCIVLCHLGIPEISVSDWRVEICGLVDRCGQLRMSDLLAFPKIEILSVHQCAGSPLDPHKPTQRVCNVKWAGARLRTVLDRFGVRPEARFVWSTGADHGNFAGVECDAYTKDLPLGRIDEDVLLAYEMNGSRLSQEQGFPVRLVVPGFYGTNSVKWLSRIELAADRAAGPFTTQWYNEPDEFGQGRHPVWALAPQSVIVHPRTDRPPGAHAPVQVWGWAWCDGPLARVEVSVDGGLNWMDARLEQRDGRGWQKFILQWTPSGSGSYSLMSRAVASDGQQQPLAGRRNAIFGVTIEVS